MELTPSLALSAVTTSELVAAWVAAVGTAGATLLAATAVAMGVADKRRAQAALVSVWFSGLVYVRNASQLPAWDIHVERLRGGDSVDDDGQASLQPGEEWTPWGTLPSGTVEALFDGRSTLRLSFTDSAGRRWRREWPTGKLTHLRKEPPWHSAR